MGELHSHTPIDGGMFVNPFLPDLENNALAGERAGVDKKHFATFYFENYAAGGITKTAGFAATNDRMRRSESWRILGQNMCNRKWIKEYGDAAGTDINEVVDITKDYEGNEIDWAEKSVYYVREDENGINRLRKLAKVENVGPNQYQIYEYIVNKDGTIADPEKKLRTFKDANGNITTAVTIDNNWSLFQNVFGGQWSLEIVEGELQPSEHSRKLMVEAMNRIGYKKDQNHSYDSLSKDGKLFRAYGNATVNEVKDQDDVWQPLKYSDVHFAPNIGAIKSSQMNVNPKEAMSLEMDLNVMTIKMAQLGIQLDKEHHADESEVSMPTQIIQACANKGYTLGHSTQLYRTLANLTELAIEDCMDGILDYLPEGEHKGTLQAEIAQIIVDRLIHSQDDNDALHAVLGHLEEKIKAGGKLTPEDVQRNIPWSDTVVYNKIYSDLASHLSRQAVKMKFDGTLAVICPTHMLEKLYGNKRLNNYTAIEEGAESSISQMIKEQEEIAENKAIFDITRDGNDPDIVSNLLSKIDTQHIYKVIYDDGQTELITVNYPSEYEYLRQQALKFSYVSKEELGGALAKTMPDGTIKIANDFTMDEFLNYIAGTDETNLTSKQKDIVFARLELEGYSRQELIDMLSGDVEAARTFIKLHELVHRENGDHLHYPTDKEGNALYGSEEAISIEMNAMRESWRRFKVWMNDEGDEVGEIQKSLAEVTKIHESIIEYDEEKGKWIPQGRELSAYNVRFKLK